jgi:VWFA-related protein
MPFWPDAGKALLIAMLISACMVAQQEPATAVPKFASRSELVLVPTVVRDKSGKHIAGLKKDDFTVLQNGKEQRVALFEEVHTSAKYSRPAAEQGFSNFVPADESRRLTIIALDLINTPFLAQVKAREALIKFLSNSVISGEPMALLILSRDGIRQVHGYTSDPAVLIAALKKAGSRQSMVEQASDPAPFPKGDEQAREYEDEVQKLTKFEADPETMFTAFQQKGAIRITLSALEQLAQA